MKKYLISLLAWMLVPALLFAREQAVDILVLSSHTESSGWAQRMLRPLDKLVRERPSLDIEVSHLQLLAHPDVAALEHARDSILDMYKVPPRLVILLGGSAFNYAVDVQKRWEGIPMLLLGEQDYYCDIEYTLLGPGDPKAHRYPLSSLVNRGYNLTLVSAPAFIRRTVEMIFQVQPDLEKFFFVAGENYHCKERQWRVEQYMKQHHQDIPFRIISSADTNTDKLLSLLRKESGPRTAVLYGSWLVREDYLENVSTRHTTISLLDDIVPLYTLFPDDMETHPFLMGFCSYSQDEYERTVEQRITDILDHKVRPSRMPFTYLEAAIPTLNYRAMEHFRLDTSLIPTDARVVGAPKTIWQEYKIQITWTALLLLLGLACFVFFTMSRSMRSLKKARVMAENASNLKTAFIQNINHEVRTPLNAITGFSQLLCLPDGCISDQEKSEYLSYIMNNTQLLTVMMNDMLTITDMENSHYNIEKLPADLNEMVRQAVKAVEAKVPKGVELICRPGLADEARFVTDGIRVQQILINFLTNACKHTTSGEIVIGSSLEENPGKITFYVVDTGPGVPPEQAEAIFERFVKLEANKQGVGLGLSICRLVAKILGGKVWLDTGYTKGARFVLAIPRQDAPPAA